MILLRNNMRYKVNIGGTPAGFVARATPKGGTLERIVAGLYTAYDGSMYFKALGGLDVYLGPFYKQHGFSSLIDRCLVVVDKNGDADVYINRDLPLMAKIIPRRQFQVGDPIGLAEIAGVAEMRCEGIDIPSTSGVMLFLSAGWRRGIFFDYRPLQEEPFELPDPNRTFGQIYEYLVFEDLFAIPVDVRAQLYDAGWFPFVSLIGGTFEELPSFLEIGELGAWEVKLVEEFPEATAREMLDRWSSNQRLATHLPVLTAGVERFIAGDYVSAVNNVWPRVEGILRSLYELPGRAGQNKLTSNLRDMLAGKPNLPGSFFPEAFRDYLLAYYFKDFDLPSSVPLSRHSVAHGVWQPSSSDHKAALIALLIVDQLHFYLYALGVPEVDVGAAQS